MPVQWLELTELTEAREVATFPLLVPAFVPEGIPLHMIRVSDYADDTQNVRILYLEPGGTLYEIVHGGKKMVDVQLTMTEIPVPLDSIARMSYGNVLDIREVQVRGQVGYTYWSRSVSAGNWATLTWREGALDIRVSVIGPWPQPHEYNPHGLDETLLRIAESLQTLE
ncbi:MAG: hypothetical protein CEE40_08505 [Chloroflexi bacterium B3_Chlor]|nr:MAG: hypothetical protein CEE40_08505 [Chloroflexi bacterium B3_Chlor]